jgi:NitT/TauT family transport system substrate-binding protein
MKLRLSAISLAFVSTVALAAAGCQAATSGSSEPGSIKVALPTSVTSFANADVVVAEEKGFFDDVGLDVELTNLKSGASTVKAVVGGQYEVGGSSIEPVVNAVAEGGDLRIIGSYADRLEVQVVTPKSIASPAELRGQVLGVQEVGAFREVMTRMVLQDAGLTPEDVEYLPTNSDAYASALIQGRIKSAVLHPEQTLAAAEESSNLHPIASLYDVEPKYHYGTYFGNGGWLEESPDDARKFMEAVTRAHRYMYADKAGVVPIIAKATGFSEAVIDEAYDVYMSDVKAFPTDEGLDQERLEYTLDRMEELEVTEGETPALDELVEREPGEQAVKELGSVPDRTG